jgi:hypothetical protein
MYGASTWDYVLAALLMAAMIAIPTIVFYKTVIAPIDQRGIEDRRLIAQQYIESLGLDEEVN